MRKTLHLVEESEKAHTHRVRFTTETAMPILSSQIEAKVEYDATH